MLVFRKVWRDTLSFIERVVLGHFIFFEQIVIEVVIAIANLSKSMSVNIFLGHRIANNENIWKSNIFFLQCFPIIEARSVSNDYEQNNKQKNELNCMTSSAWEENHLLARASKTSGYNSFSCAWISGLGKTVCLWELLWHLFKQFVLLLTI